MKSRSLRGSRAMRVRWFTARTAKLLPQAGQRCSICLVPTRFFCLNLMASRGPHNPEREH